MIQNIQILKAGQTPFDATARGSAGYQPGPWGETAAAAIKAFEAATGETVAEYWEREEDLWVILEQPEERDK